MMKNTYNGWTNKQTWNINLTYSEIFINMLEEQTFEDLEHVADAFESVVNELELDNLREGTLAFQAVGEYLDAVNWQEIAENHAEDLGLFNQVEEAFFAE